MIDTGTGGHYNCHQWIVESAPLFPHPHMRPHASHGTTGGT